MFTPAVDHTTHTLTVHNDGTTVITEHIDDPTFTLHSGCLVYKIAHRAFETRPAVTHALAEAPTPGVYRVGIADDGNLDVFGRITDPTTEQETHA